MNNVAFNLLQKLMQKFREQVHEKLRPYTRDLPDAGLEWITIPGAKVTQKVKDAEALAADRQDKAINAQVDGINSVQRDTVTKAAGSCM